MEEEDQIHKCARIMSVAKKIGVVMREYQGPSGFAYSFIDPIGGMEMIGPCKPTKEEGLESACDLWQKSIQLVV